MITGDFRKLQDLITRVHELGKGQGLTDVTRAMADDALMMVRNQFRAGTDPYGRPWAPHAPTTRPGPLLMKTRALFRSFRVARTNREGFVLESGVPYAGVLHNGADYLRGGSISFRNKRGRIIKIGPARIKASQRKRGFVKVVPHGSHRVVIPARMIFPVQGFGLGTWGDRLARVALRKLRGLMRAR